MTIRSYHGHSAEALSFLLDGGEMGALIRSKDWGSSPLGYPESWPGCIKTAVSLCLNSRIASVLWLGPELRLVYNDAYLPFLGRAKHPAALGARGDEVWSEMWEFFGPIHDEVQQGRSVHVADFQLFLSRDRQHEEVYVTFDHTPIRQENIGAVQGVFCTCVESTDKIIIGRRLATLRDLVHPTPKNQTIDAVCKKIAAVIDANPLDIPFAAIYLPDENQEKARRICAVRVAPDSNALPEVLSVTEMTAKIPAWPLNETSETHQVIEINHLQSQIGSFRAPILGDEVETGIIYPLTRTWQQRPAGFLIAGLSPYRVFDADYRSFLELTGRQISNSIGDAYALELDQGNGEMFTEGTAVEVPSSRGPNPLDELPAMSRLNEFSNRWRSISDLPTLLQEVLRATMQLHNADFGDVQLYNEVTQCLEIVAYSGLDEEFLRYFKMVDASDTSAYGLALAGLCRIMIEDVTTDPVFEPHREIAAKTGFRAVQSTPLFEPNGDKPLGMLSTYFRDPRRLSERELVLTDLYARQAAEVISAKISEQRLRESRVRLQHAAELIGLCCYSWNPQTNALEWDAGLRSIWGLPPDALVDYGTFISGVHPDDRTRVEKAIAAAVDPAGDGVYDMEHRVMSASHGVERWIATRGQTTFESSIPVAFFGVALDITERKRADQAREVLISELQHRTRNLLAVVGSIAAETIASTRSVQEFRSAFNSRLLSLARVQGLLSRSEEDITISQLVQLELSALGAEPDGARIIVEGPIICLPSRSVQILALALHELATNARKYGALATRDGRLSVTWKSIEEGQNRMLELEWRETGLAPRKTKTAAPHNGFGRSLIEEALPFQLSAQTELVINQEEVRCTISLALAGRGV